MSFKKAIKHADSRASLKVDNIEEIQLSTKL